MRECVSVCGVCVCFFVCMCVCICSLVTAAVSSSALQHTTNTHVHTHTLHTTNTHVHTHTLHTTNTHVYTPGVSSVRYPAGVASLSVPLLPLLLHPQRHAASVSVLLPAIDCSLSLDRCTVTEGKRWCVEKGVAHTSVAVNHGDTVSICGSRRT